MMLLRPPEYAVVLRNDLAAFTERAFYELNPNTLFAANGHLEVIASKLEDCRNGKIKRLIINLPPRSLKSISTTIAFAAWLLGHRPSTEIICASYGQDLSDKFAADCRTVMTSSWYRDLFRTRVFGRQAVADFVTTDLGGRMSTSVGGVLTGRGADFIIIDDPLKPDEALSETRRNAVNNWYDNSLLSRLNNKATGCIIIIMQRLHQDDLVGHVLQQDHWEVLSFPAIAEEDETFFYDTAFGPRIFRRKRGEALHVERESLDTLQQIRETIGEYNFNGQYQQNPTPPGGAMVKTAWLKRYLPNELPVRFARIVQSWDTANKASELSDFSVCTTWGITYGKYYLLHVFRQRLEYPDLKRALIRHAHFHKANTILIEDKASGTQLIQDLKASGLFGVTAYAPPPGTDKIMRLHAQTAMFENGIVHLPAEAPWLGEYLRELTTFPGMKFDDQVDSTTQLLDYLRSTFSPLEVWERLARPAHVRRS
jgi:predicted phage terminase large subunit-like protein